MNIWTNGSFEDPDPDLTLEGSASINDSPDYWPDGTKGLVLACAAPPPLGGSGTSSRARKTLPTIPGVPYPISAMAALALAGSPTAPVSVQARTVGGAVLATLSTTSGGSVFAPWAPGSFVAAEAQTVVELRAEQPVSGGAQWALDLIEVLGPDGGSDVARHKHEARVALLNLLKGINGSPYWTNFEGRVYTRLFDPTDDSGIAKPFACVIQDEPSEAPLYHKRSERKWKFQIHAFFGDNRDSSSRDTAAAELCDKFEDDLVQALLTDPKLGGTVDSLDLESVDPIYGGDDTFAVVVATIAVSQIAGLGDLGPTA